MLRPLALLTVLFSLLFVAACGGDDDSDGSSGSGSDNAAQTEASDDGGGGDSCETVDAPQPKPDGGEKRPKDKLDPNRDYRVEMTTNCGSFTIALDVEQAPNATASFAELARNGFYDGTTFHRVVPGFVIQGGDPTGSGTGGPGYSTVDKPPANVSYTNGVVAMAKSAAEAPGTSGSQFYVVTGADAGLPPDYAVLGEVVEGMDTVERIDALGQAGADGPPSQAIVIEKATLSES